MIFGLSLSDIDVDSLYALTGGFVSQGLTAVTGVVIARMLGPELKGVQSLLVLLVVYVSLFAGLGLPDAIPYFLAGQRATWTNLLRRTAPFIIPLLVLLVPLHLFLASRLQLNTYVPAWALGLTVAAAPFSFMRRAGLSVLLGHERHGPFNLLRNVQPGVFALGLALLWIVGGVTITMVAATWAASMIVAGVAAMLGAAWFVSDASSHSEAEEDIDVQEVIGFGLKSQFGSAAPFESFKVDFALVGWLFAPAALGLYSAAAAFIALPNLLMQSLGYVAYPRAARAATSDSRRALFRRWLLIGLAVSALTIAPLLLVIEPLTVLLFGQAFAPAAPIARILLVGSAFLALRRLVGAVVRGSGHPGLPSISELLLVVLVVLLAPLVSARYDLAGVAWSVVVAAGLSFVTLLVMYLRAEHKRADGEDELPKQEQITELDPGLGTDAEVV